MYLNVDAHSGHKVMYFYGDVDLDLGDMAVDTRGLGRMAHGLGCTRGAAVRLGSRQENRAFA